MVTHAREHRGDRVYVFRGDDTNWISEGWLGFRIQKRQDKGEIMCNVLRVRKNIVYSEASSSGISWREEQKVSRVQTIQTLYATLRNLDFTLPTMENHRQILRKGVT